MCVYKCKRSTRMCFKFAPGSVLRKLGVPSSCRVRFGANSDLTPKVHTMCWA